MSLDALVAAPAHHELLFENERVRVLDTRVEPGDTVPLHTHPWPAIQYFLAVADIVRRDEAGEVVVDSRVTPLPPQRPLVLWSEPMPAHTLENVGDGALHVLVVELKQPS